MFTWTEIVLEPKGLSQNGYGEPGAEDWYAWAIHKLRMRSQKLGISSFLGASRVWQSSWMSQHSRLWNRLLVCPCQPRSSLKLCGSFLWSASRAKKSSIRCHCFSSRSSTCPCRKSRRSLTVRGQFLMSASRAWRRRWMDFLSHRSASYLCSQWRWPSSGMTRFLVRLVEGSPSFVAPELPSLPAVRQVAVENAIRRRICPYRHGFSCAAPLP